MKMRPFDPRKLDVLQAAADGLEIEGTWPVAEFARLVEGAPQDGEVKWRVRGEQRAAAGAQPQVWLQLSARARLWRDCQRCLQPVALDIDVQRAIRFVADEATAELLDADSEDDVLAMPRRLDLYDLVEDELLLALPIVPMHERCPVSLPHQSGSDEHLTETDDPKPRPFAGLAALKRGSAT